MNELGKSIFTEKKDFFFTMNKDSKIKLSRLFRLLKHDFAEVKEYETLERVTQLVLKKDKLDDIFLLWLHYVGHYIKLKYTANWILLRLQINQELLYFPALINDDMDVWQVGKFCHKSYYSRKKAKNISFNTFYKLNIERVILKPKLRDLNFPEESLILLQ